MLGDLAAQGNDLCGSFGDVTEESLLGEVRSGADVVDILGKLVGLESRRRCTLGRDVASMLIHIRTIREHKIWRLTTS